MGQYRDEKLLNKIVAKIKKLRTQHDITLDQFYTETNVHISRIESSKANISVSTMNKICERFGMTLHEFFKDIDKY